MVSGLILCWAKYTIVNIGNHWWPWITLELQWKQSKSTCDRELIGHDTSHRGLKLDGAIGQGEICNSLKSEKFSKSFLSHIGKNKIKF